MKMLKKMEGYCAGAVLLGAASLAQASPALSAESVVVLQYHHVSDSTPAVTSISPSQFKAHLQYLQDNDFNVMDIHTAQAAIESGEQLPEKAVVITFDDGYQNVYDNAADLLHEFDMPYTVFINPELLRKHTGHYMGWEELKAMQDKGATIANHGQSHGHLIRQKANENVEEWEARMHDDIVGAQTAIDEHLGEQIKYFAYPYGEYNDALRSLLDEWGYLAFAQHSGPWSQWSEKTVITRFPASGVYANLDTLKVKLNSKALPVSAYQPSEPLLGHDERRPRVRVTLEPGATLEDVRTNAMRCFIGGDTLEPEWGSDTQFSVTLKSDLPLGRSRVNCTAPSASESRYYWYSVPFIRPDEAGNWPG